jgi:hypothetical protein
MTDTTQSNGAAYSANRSLPPEKQMAQPNRRNVGGATAVVPAPAVAPRAAGNAPAAVVSEGSLIGRFVALLTPVLAILAGLLADWVARLIPGAHLDTTQVTTFMVTAATAVAGADWKWLQGWQQHEQLVANGNATPVV